MNQQRWATFGFAVLMVMLTTLSFGMGSIAATESDDEKKQVRVTIKDDG